MAAKRFMFICIGILALACAYAMGASNSVAQSTPSDVATSYIATNPGTSTVVTVNGDIYAKLAQINGDGVWSNNAPWTYMGNCFVGAVPNQQNTLGGVKSLFR